jgi:hypothetical protein
MDVLPVAFVDLEVLLNPLGTINQVLEVLRELGRNLALGEDLAYSLTQDGLDQRDAVVVAKSDTNLARRKAFLGELENS